jgi:hypothetical protein
MRNKLLLFLLVNSTLLSADLFAQQYRVLPSGETNNFYPHKFFMNDKKEYFDITFDYNGKRHLTDLFINKYDNTLKLLFSKDCSQTVKGKKYEAALLRGDKLCLFLSDDNTLFKYTFDERSGSLSGEAEELFTFSEKGAKFFTGYSPDSSKCFILAKNYKKGEQTFNGAIVDNKLNRLSSFTITTGVDRDDIGNLHYLLSEKGAFTMIFSSGSTDRNDVYTSREFYHIDVNEKGVANSRVVLPVRETVGNTDFTLAQDTLKFWGFAAKNSKDRYSSLVTGSYDLKTKKMGSTREINFADVPVFQKADKQYIRDLAQNGMNKSFNLINKFRNNDGSTITVWEISSFERVERTNYSVTFYRTGPVCVVKMNAQNDIEYLRLLSKGQEEAGLDWYTGIVTMKDNNDGVHILFHDNPNTEPETDHIVQGVQASEIANYSLSAVYIDKYGKTTKKTLFPNKQNEEHLSPNRSFSFVNEEIICLAVKNKRIGKETFRVNKITLTK